MSPTNKLRKLLVLSTSLSLMILTACGTTTAMKSSPPVTTDVKTGVVISPVSAPVVQTLCTDDGPVDWDPADLVRHPDPNNPGHFTNETLKNIKRHNAVWDKVCGAPH